MDHKRENWTPPLARVMGDSRQQYDIAIGRVPKVTLRESREEKRDKSSYYTNICMASSVSRL